MTATATRDASYHQLTDLGEKQAAVFAVIAERGPVSDRQIAALLEWPINRVNPRRNELVERGLVVEAGVTFDAETGRNVTLWYVISHEQKQQGDMPGTAPLTDCPPDALQAATSRETGQAAMIIPPNPEKLSQTEATLKTPTWSTPLGRALVEADKAARDAGLTGYWIELYRLVATATTQQELDYAAKVIARYKVAKYPQYQVIRALGEQKKKELSR